LPPPFPPLSFTIVSVHWAMPFFFPSNQECGASLRLFSFFGFFGSARSFFFFFRRQRRFPNYEKQRATFHWFKKFFFNCSRLRGRTTFSPPRENMCAPLSPLFLVLSPFFPPPSGEGKGDWPCPFSVGEGGLSPLSLYLQAHPPPFFSSFTCRAETRMDPFFFFPSFLKDPDVRRDIPLVSSFFFLHPRLFFIRGEG